MVETEQPTVDERGIDAIDEFYAESGRRFGYERTTPTGVLSFLTFQLIEAERLDEAAAVLLRDPEAYPPGSMLLAMLAAGYAESGLDERALEYYRKSLEANPGSAIARKALDERGVDPATVVPKVDVSAEVLASYVGSYEYSSTTTLTVMVENGQLAREVNGGRRAELVPMSQDTFYLMNNDVQYTFNLGEIGEVEDLTVTQFGQRRQARKVD